ncbi:MAG TPA: murein biosynthesis integral membrane protein MurJ, partial [Gemmatimonadaceae bacterium]|nr:murein biosynthesis integral membrane protein MurJ [Gemmatimonadaceae bacterium]
MSAEPRPVTSRHAPRRSTGKASVLVASGILGSRVLGLLRQSLMARYLGAGVASDAFVAAFKIPNLLQNLFGEGALSAAFIPVYARLLAEGDEREADRVAGAVAAILALAVSVFVLVGVLAAPWLIYVVAFGFSGERRDLTIALTRVLFPGAGLLVLSAWCLGVLNSHRKFLVSYAAPIAWNVAMIVALIVWGRHPDKARVAVYLAWASVVGSALQLLIQLPVVRRVAPEVRIRLSRSSAHVREVLRNFGPAFVSRGVVQLSSYIDQFLTSFLPEGMVTVFAYSTTLYNLPVSVFGMAISAAELPEMARSGVIEGDASAALRGRLDAGLRRIAFFVVPSAVAFLALGDVLARLLFEHGRFTALDSVYTWGVLCGSAVGLVGGTLGRLYSSTYYALRDTRTPLRFAIMRVAATTVLGVVGAFVVPRWLGVDPRWGTAGLTASAGLAAWLEFTLLRSRMNARIGVTGLTARYTITLWALAVAAAGIAVMAQGSVMRLGRMTGGVAVIALYGVAYLGGALLARVPEAQSLLGAVARRLR